MANLITEKQKKAVKTEYLQRLCSVSLLIAALLGIFLLAYLVPYYLALDRKDAKVAEQFKSVISVENKENVGQSVSLLLSQTLGEMKTVELYYKNNFDPSSYITDIVNSKNSNIQINKFYFETTRAQFVVTGVSKNREGLVSFIDSLRLNSNFTNVDSPISNFAKDSNISFSINIKIKI